MKNNKWEFTQIQKIILMIMASFTVFVLAIDINYYFKNPLTDLSIIEITTSPSNNGIKTEAFLTETTIPSMVPTRQLPSTSPQFSSTSIQTINPVITSEETITTTPSSTPPPKFFTNEWDVDTTKWNWFSTRGDDNLWDVYNEAGILVFSLLGKDTNAYFVYTPHDYEKVTIRTRIEVRSNTKSSTVIVCNYSEENGWYEFNIGTDGLWDVRLHDSLGKTGYLSMISGGSLAIDTGEGFNEYTASCNGNHLSLSINGSEVIDYTDQIKKFERGKIGLGILSYSQVPILVESAWIEISQP